MSESITRGNATLRTVNLYRLSQEPRSSICRKQITDNPSRIFYVGSGRAILQFIRRQSFAHSHWKWQTHDASYPKYRRSAMENLIIKTDVTVSIITIFYIAPNKSNELAESISLQLQLTASTIYLYAHELSRFVSQCFITIFSRVWFNIIDLIKL